LFLKLRPIIVSVIYFLGLEFIVLKHNFVLGICAFLVVLSLWEGRKIGGYLRFSVLPAFFSISSVALLYMVTLNYEQQVFILLSSSLYYLSLLGAYRLGKYDQDATAIGMIMAGSATTIFFTYAGTYGLYLNFLVPLYYLMIAYLMVTMLVSYQCFSLFEKNDRKTNWIYSFVLSLAMAEIIWTMNFWPFGYLTTGVIALILYYVLWDLALAHIRKTLSKKRLIANLAVFSFLILAVLLTSKWIPVI
jgi:hypothetical protein